MGIAGPLAVVVYFIVWSLINGPFSVPIASVVYREDKREGDFRFQHVNVRANAESIAFYDSARTELDEMTRTFNSLLSKKNRTICKHFLHRFAYK